MANLLVVPGNEAGDYRESGQDSTGNRGRIRGAVPGIGRGLSGVRVAKLLDCRRMNFLLFN